MHILIDILRIVVAIILRMDVATPEERAKLHNKLNLL